MSDSGARRGRSAATAVRSRASPSRWPRRPPLAPWPRQSRAATVHPPAASSSASDAIISLLTTTPWPMMTTGGGVTPGAGRYRS